MLRKHPVQTSRLRRCTIARLNKSWRNDRGAPVFFDGISNAILQFARHLICWNSYNSLTVNIPLIEIIGSQGGGWVGCGDGLRAGKMLRCTRWRQGVCGLQITISLKCDGMPREKRNERSLFPLALAEIIGSWLYALYVVG